MKLETYIERVGAAEKMKKKTCVWTFDEQHGAWDTSCGEKHFFETDGPTGNKHKFCPYCGKPLEVKP